MTKGFFGPHNNSDHIVTEKILALKFPDYRKAYSDRTAFLMACLSEVSYVIWESPFDNVPVSVANKIQQSIIDKMPNKTISALLTDYLTSLLINHDQEQKQLIEDLKAFRLEIDSEFSWISDRATGTQAFIAFNDDFAVLVFRGTEAKSVKDIRTDSKAKLITSTAAEGGRVHEGFQTSFNAVKVDIESALLSDSIKNKPLYITGHSLGGGLATIATRDLLPPVKISACYTFGSPRVGSEDWVNGVKSPVYRLVNAADAVTMLPPGSVPMTSLMFLVELLPGIGTTLKNWLSQFNGYLHIGNMRYMSDCPLNDYSNVKLLYSVNFFYRIKAVFEHNILRRFVKDHAISVYRKKLEQLALSRNYIK